MKRQRRMEDAIPSGPSRAMSRRDALAACAGLAGAAVLGCDTGARTSSVSAGGSRSPGSVGEALRPGAQSLAITVRRAEERGHGNHGWLDSRHTFSFADYQDPRHMGFRALRVINEDRVQPAAGFPTHPHRDMEILSYVLEGGLQHRDSAGNGSVIRPGEVQRMSAGSGIYHSEFNTSSSELVHFLQIWILPAERGLEPSYEQKSFAAQERRGRLRLVASPDGRDGSVTVHQDMSLYAGLFAAGEQDRHELANGRHAWIHVARGRVKLSGLELAAGDGAAVSGTGQLDIAGAEDSEILVFDLA